MIAMVEFFTTQLGFSVLLMAAIIGVMMTAMAYCILLERKVAAWVQDRYGPNRVGPGGLLQPLADGGKFLLKEDIISANVDKPLFVLAPAIAFAVSLLGFAVIPWAGKLALGGNMLNVQVASIDIGLLYILAIGSLSVYGVVLGGWASNNKYSFYGAMRATAQMLSYEIPMGLSILVVVLTTGEVRLERIVDAQLNSTWNVLLHPVAFVLLLITVFAEANRTPFDLAEAEQELVGGYQTEYSALKMGLFYLGEYAHMITASAFMAVLFFGGWELFPFSDRLGLGLVQWLNHSPSMWAMLARFAVMGGKVFVFIFFFMWVRWTVPRFRFDQLMRLAWRGMVPLGLGLVCLAGLLVYSGRPASFWATLGNVAVMGITLGWIAFRRTPVTGRQAHLPPIEGFPATR